MPRSAIHRPACGHPACDCRIFKGKVVEITRGDTTTVLDNGRVKYRVRLADIDAPEKGQAFADASKQHSLA